MSSTPSSGRCEHADSPTDDERAQLQRVADAVMADAEAAIADLPVEAEVVQVGSTARGTWTAGDRDVDVFVCFPTSTTASAGGVRTGHRERRPPEGHEEYAEHPYVVGEFDGFDVDLVPCFDRRDATKSSRRWPDAVNHPNHQRRQQRVEEDDECE